MWTLSFKRTIISRGNIIQWGFLTNGLHEGLWHVFNALRTLSPMGTAQAKRSHRSSIDVIRVIIFANITKFHFILHTFTFISINVVCSNSLLWCITFEYLRAKCEIIWGEKFSSEVIRVAVVDKWLGHSEEETTVYEDILKIIRCDVHTIANAMTHYVSLDLQWVEHVWIYGFYQKYVARIGEMTPVNANLLLEVLNPTAMHICTEVSLNNDLYLQVIGSDVKQRCESVLE